MSIQTRFASVAREVGATAGEEILRFCGAKSDRVTALCPSRR